MDGNIVWLNEERTHAELISLGAYCSLVRYTRDGVIWEVIIDNDEFNFIEDEND